MGKDCLEVETANSKLAQFRGLMLGMGMRQNKHGVNLVGLVIFPNISRIIIYTEWRRTDE
jgi:hypothetical protein